MADHRVIFARDSETQRPCALEFGRMEFSFFQKIGTNYRKCHPELRTRRGGVLEIAIPVPRELEPKKVPIQIEAKK